ncbi:glutathione peroxidase [Humitalea sp. 24SJ18S-53]|uniref:glutathione peroxidase n=1 Tax=Humitalea sp. 24SJ18S-53 TaxID=3422307 RepID=UPI003D67CB6E
MARAAQAQPGSFYEFTLTSLEGEALPLAAWRGRPVLVVNTASFCGYTPQFAGLQVLADRFAARGLVVLGVPSNDFNQEAGDASRVRAICDTHFGITFPMAAIGHVRGPRAMPLFRWLAERGGGAPRWNFHKFLVARDGLAVRGFVTNVEPGSPGMLRAVDAALG